MHDDEVTTTLAQVQRLLAAQFPQWADLPLRSLAASGTDHAIYRLGDDLSVRLPRTERATPQIEKEQQWLPVFAPHLPIEIPAPLATGVPGEGYPFPWSIHRWIDGHSATFDTLVDPVHAAKRLAEFVRALWQIDTTGGPVPGAHNFYRGVPLVNRDTETRAAIASLEGMIDTQAALEAWRTALDAPAWQQPPVWIHGDLQAGNLLARAGNLTAVIDFGGLGVGDPACDLQVAWNLFTGESRQAFRETVQVDDATWARGRGWALSVAVIALPYYQRSNPSLAAISRRAIAAVLDDHHRLIG